MDPNNVLNVLIRYARPVDRKKHHIMNYYVFRTSSEYRLNHDVYVAFT